MATLFDSASLALIPSGVKDGKAYSIKPTDGSGDFTFSRGTDTATRVNASGLIEKERGNLLLQSNTFNTTWSLTNTSLTSGQSGYDGSSDAWELDAVAGGSYVSQNVSISGVHTFSTYLKAGTTDYVLLLTGGAGNAFFNLSGSGAVGTTSGLIDAKIESVGGGWFRCSITQNASTSFYRLYPANSGGTSAGSIYIQDAQLEQGLVATDYIETTTAAVYEGITDNLPRLDYSGGASCPSLLLEPSRSNLLPHSEYVNAMSLSSISATANATTSPEGVVNGYEVEPTGTGFKTIGNFVSVTAGSKYTISFFYKNNDHKNIGFYDNNTSGSEISINVQDNTFTLGASCDDGDVEDYGNGWYRAWCTFTASNSTLANYLIFRSDSNSGSYTATGSSIYVYGFQLEAGSYPTSYIPTYGTSASRAEDICNDTGLSSIIGQTEGTLFLDFNPLEIADTSRYLSIESASGAGSGWIGIFGSSPNKLRFYGDGFDLNLAGYSVGDRVKMTLTYKNGVATDIYINGVNKGSITANTTGKDYSVLRIGKAVIGGIGAGEFKQVLIFPTALTNAEASALTTL